MSDTLDQPEQKKPQRAKESPVMSMLSIVISLFFIVRGSMYMGTNMQTWGVVLIVVGIVGLVFKIYTLTQNRG